MQDIEFKKLKAKSELGYSKIEKIKCPYFNDYVKFNRKGLEHIKFKSWRRSRLIKDQKIRLKYLYLAPLVLKKSNTLQGISVTKNFERVRINSRWDRILKKVYYFEFIAVVENVRVRVIIKQIEGGKKYFWSIIPFWKVNKNYRKRILISGDPEKD